MTALVLGAGQIGARVATLMSARGDEVRVGTRSGTTVSGTASVRVDAADADAVTRAAEGAATLVVCTNPPYAHWASAWPPVFSAVERAAERTGALVVLMGNLYGYGAVRTPMTESTIQSTTERKGAIRRAGGERLAAADAEGRIRAVEVRASDYVGPGAGPTAHLGAGFFEPLLAHRTAWVVGDPAALHSWAYLDDIAATLVAAADAADRTGTGRAFHVPAAAYARTEIAAQVARLGDGDRVRGIPTAALRMLGAVSPMLREVAASSYQFTGPFVSDSTETERLLGVRATAWDEVLERTVASYR